MRENLSGTDLILFSNAIYTMREDEKISGGIAICGNKIQMVGTHDEVAKLANEKTKVYDLGDQMVIPGLIEGHTHIDGPLFLGSRANLRGISSQPLCVAAAKKWADTHRDTDWVFGFGWHSSDWEDKKLPDKKLLDQAIPDRPVCLTDIGGHCCWMNSKALQKLGIGREEIDLLDQFGYRGKVFRYDDGEPTGLVQDGPLFYLWDLSLEFVHKEPEKYLREAARMHLEKGITSIHDMFPYKAGNDIVESLGRLLEQASLDFRVFFQMDLLETSVEDALEYRKKYDNDRLRLVGMKAIADCVWADRSAAVLREYKGTPGNYGQLYLEPETWTDKIDAANQNGFSTHLHCSGNRAVRTALDVYEEVLRRRGPGDYRNTIEHCDTVHPDDIPRFGQLGIMANVTPDLLYKTVHWKDSPCFDVYDDITRSWAWPFKSMINAGAVVTFGMDSPCSTFDPLVQIYRSVTRVCEDCEPAGGFLPHEKVSILEALRCYTINGAYEAFMEDKLGTLERGKLADIAVLDRDIVAGDPFDIRNAKVTMTICDGRIVYENM